MPFPELPAASGVLPVLASEHCSLGNDALSLADLVGQGLPAASPSPFLPTAIAPDSPASPPPSRLQIVAEVMPTAMAPDFPPPKRLQIADELTPTAMYPDFPPPKK